MLDSKARRARTLCVAEALLDGSVTWSGAGKLNGRYAFVGHSTGGLSVFAAAAAIVNSPAILEGHELVSVAAIAPNRVLDADVSALTLTGPNAPPYFVLQGTRDGDTSGGAFSSYDLVRPQLVGGQVTTAPRKALVWAYRVEHNKYGGVVGGCSSSPLGIALARDYVGAFLLATFYEDPASLDLFFGTASPKLTSAVADPLHWLAFDEKPQVYGTSVQQVKPEAGFTAYVLDGFENNDETKSDGGLDVVVNQPYAEAPANTVDNLHRTNAAFLQWSDGDMIAWTLDADARTELTGATSLTFRIGAAVDVEDQINCSGVIGEVPNLSLLVSDAMNQYPLDLMQYGRLALPDPGLEDQCAAPFGTDGCHAWDVMQTTFRVPLADLCSIDPNLFLSEISEVALRFNGTGGLLLLDDVTIHSVPGEAAVDCRCPA